VEEIFL